ncbi:uncharacterized protein LOC135391353 isoform X1 [Ornithodoros turicata]|uniref:uncharacterized protein LOC135391353 isoform X1 n=1 Tax=Ornithodoros turicata TaxID=34597 RepID=UPI0031386DF1
MLRVIFLIVTVGLCASENIPQNDVFAVNSVQDDDFYSQDVGDAEKLRVIIGDSSGWVNPHNMFSYNQGSQVNRPSERSESTAETDEPISEDTVTPSERKALYSKKAWATPKLVRTKPPPPTQETQEVRSEPAPLCDPCDCKCRELKTDLQKCQADLQAVRLRAVLADVESPRGSSTGCDRDRQFVYLRRLALSFVYHAKFRRRNIQSNIKLSILLSPEEISALEQLARHEESRAEELESHLSAILASSTVVPDIPMDTGIMAAIATWCTSVFGQPRAEWIVPGLALLGVLLFAALHGASWRVVFLAVVIYLFFASFLWHWVHLYKVTEAHREAYLKQNVDAASKCTPDYEPGVLSSIADMFRTKVDCEQYYEEIHVSPLWRNSPMVVLSETLFRSILHPLLFSGKYLGRFMSDFYGHLTWWSILPASAFLVCVTIVLLALCLGYAVVLPCGLGTLNPLRVTAKPKVKGTGDTQDPPFMTHRAAPRSVEEGQGDCSVVTEKVTAELPEKRDINGSETNRTSTPQVTAQESVDKDNETRKAAPPAVGTPAAEYVEDVADEEISEEEDDEEDEDEEETS